MCVVSAVHDYFKDRTDLWPPGRVAPVLPSPWPGQVPTPYTPMPPVEGVSPTQFDRETFEKLKDVLTKLGEIDKKLGEPDCVDPAKEAWMREVERRLKELEAK